MSSVISIARPRRWDRPFDPDMDEATVERVAGLDFFQRIDTAGFRPPITLSELIRNDARLVSLCRGDVVVQQGEYGNSVFLVLNGQVRVWTSSGLTKAAGDDKARRARFSVASMFKELLKPRDYPEVRDPDAYRATSQNGSLTTSSARDRGLKLTEIQNIIDNGQTVPVSSGELFGEIAALTRSPRAATVFAETDVELLEIRWQGLREMRERSPAVKAHVDGVYRSNVLRAQLAETPLFKGLSDAALDEIAARTTFETHGQSEWWHEMAKSQVDAESHEVVEQEPVIVAEGAVVEDLLLIAAGFGRITQRFGSGHRTLGIFSKNDVFGLPMLVRQQDTGDSERLPYALRAVGHVDVLRIPGQVVREQVLPSLSSGAEGRDISRLGADSEMFSAPAAGSQRAVAGVMNRRRGDTDALQPHGMDQSLFDFFFDHRIVNGTATMLINTDRCIGCDECVRAAYAGRWGLCAPPESYGYMSCCDNTEAPTLSPTTSPSDSPSASPSSSPSMHPSIVPSSTPSAKPTNRPSVAPTIECAEGYELKRGMPMHGRGCTSEGISCTQRVTAEECAAMCSNSEHCVA